MPAARWPPCRLRQKHERSVNKTSPRTTPPTVAVTRSEDSEGPLSHHLRAGGARVVNWRVARIAPPRDPAPLRDALARLGDYDWIAFTSVNAVEAVTNELADFTPGPRVAAVGEATADALRRADWPVDLIPAEADAAHLASTLLDLGTRPERVLFPASAIARPTLVNALRACGVTVDQVDAYDLADIPAPVDTWRAALMNKDVDAVTFASPSAVARLRKILGDDAFGRLADLVITAIGDTTAAAARDNALAVTAVARPSSLENLAAVTLAALGARDSSSMKGTSP
jgi:uroporphyrinogen-III synthase